MQPGGKPGLHHLSSANVWGLQRAPVRQEGGGTGQEKGGESTAPWVGHPGERECASSLTPVSGLIGPDPDHLDFPLYAEV